MEDDDEAMDVTSMDPEPPDVSSTDPEPPPPDEAKDFTCFIPELLQLPEVSPIGLNTRPEHVQWMFKQWLSLPETSKTMSSLIENAVAGAPINTLGHTVNADAAAGSSSSFSTLPALSHGLPLNLAQDPLQELKEQCISGINQIFNNPRSGLLLYAFKSVSKEHEEFKSFTKEICKLPSFFSSTLFRNIDIDNLGVATRDELIKYWVDSNMLTMNKATQIYKILKQPDREYLCQVDFQPIIEEILATHPGLEFTRNSPELQQFYAETVLYTIFFYNDRSARGRITLRDLKRGNLIDAIQQLDEEEDTNTVRRYFSYKQVHVIHGKHSELSMNGDLLIEAEDLMTYADNALSKKIVDRIFSEAPRKLASQIEGKMNYEDFVYFLLAEEDKTAESSIEYWFKCLDLDENEKITADEMKYFYEEQMDRISSIGYKPVSFEDILCRIIDMIAPEREDYITLRDFKRSKLSGNVFNILFNFDKFRAAESRDRDLIDRRRRRRKAEVEHPDWTDWDHFVHAEFSALQRDAQFMAED